MSHAVLKQERPVSKYQRIMDRRNYLLEKGRENYLKGKETIEYDMEMDCIDHFFECEGFRTYGQIALFCKENGIKRAIDIGCAYGHQSECFLIHGVDYVGVNESKLNFWNQDTFKYVAGHYPCLLPTKSNDLAVSVLCLTWNCYLREGEKTLREQVEALQRDFSHCLLYITEDAKDFVSQYFKKVVKLGRNLYYFSNRDEEVKKDEMLGKDIEFLVLQNGKEIVRQATVEQVEGHEKLGRVYVARTPYGHIVRLTANEIKRFI